MALVLKLKKGESVERGLKRMKKILDTKGDLWSIRTGSRMRPRP